MTDMTMRAMPVRSLPILTVAALLVLGPSARLVRADAAASPVTRQARSDPGARAGDAVTGVVNFTKIDATIACGGAFSPGSVTALKQAGYRSIVNLRLASEPGANVAEEQREAESQGLRYFHLPFSNVAPDAAQLDAFLKIVGAAGNQPMMLHCASGARASMFWAVKRVVIDGWPIDRAMNELPNLSAHVGPPMRAFVLDYLRSHGKTRP
jgi:uncharacterized protein (TIGR01244 family)